MNEYIVIWKDETTRTFRLSEIFARKGDIETLTSIISTAESLAYSRITIHEIF